MITLVGVGHVFAISDKVKEVIRSRQPEVVCLELDAARYSALMQRRTRHGAPIQYMILGQVQKRIADKFGSEVGDEMLAAVEAAREVGAKLALIDMDASKVFARLWKKMSFKEKVNLMLGALIGLVSSKDKVEREIESYEGNEERYLETMGEQFPSVKRVLLDDRNVHMAKRISALASEHGNIVAIVGDGHVSGIVEALGTLEVETVRLRDIRSSEPPDEAAGASYSFSYWVR